MAVLVLFVILIPVVEKLHDGSAGCRAKGFHIRIASRSRALIGIVSFISIQTKIILYSQLLYPPFMPFSYFEA
jgi:hypothetical protein